MKDAKTETSDDIFIVASGCNQAGQPFVRIHFQGLELSASAESARGVAHDLLGAAAAAESDAMLLRFFRGQNFPEGAWEVMITQWREFQRQSGAHEVRE